MTARRLDDLLRGIATPADGGIVVTGLTQDSHAVRTGDAFVALQGARTHGMAFAPDAVSRGAVVVLAEKQGPGTGDRGPGKPASLSSVPLSQTVAAGASAHGNQTNPVDAAFGPRSPVPGPAPSSSAGPRSPVPGPALSASTGPRSPVPGPAPSSSAGPRSPVPSPALSASTGPRSPVPGPAPSSSAGPRAPVPSPVIWIENLRTHLGAIAARFYDDPSAALTVIGVTGTSGKTSTVQMLAQAFTHLGRRAATIGTLGAGLHGSLRAGEHTTPDVIRVHGLLAEFRDAGATGVAMEVSSHALDQHRVDGVHFDVAVFTNLTRDHLDYHGTMEAYGAAKARLFAWPDLRAAVINVDDAFGCTLAANLENNPCHPGQGMAGTRIQGRKQQILRYGIDSAGADIRATDVQLHSDGIDFVLATPWGAGAVHSRLLGRFNVANLLAVAGVLGALEVPFDAIRGALEALEPIAGRMNRLGGGAAPLVVVDYSHKPDPLEQVLATLRAHCEGKLICVFGCGGERDAGKRPVMGAIAERLADVVIVTDDNPRGEDGDAIVTQIVAGMDMPGRATIERDRARAIGIAIGQARAGDVILIAGKGHETYQETAGVKRPFDDLEVARSTLESRPC